MILEVLPVHEKEILEGFCDLVSEVREELLLVVALFCLMFSVEAVVVLLPLHQTLKVQVVGKLIFHHLEKLLLSAYPFLEEPSCACAGMLAEWSVDSFDRVHFGRQDRQFSWLRQPVSQSRSKLSQVQGGPNRAPR